MAGSSRKLVAATVAGVSISAASATTAGCTTTEPDVSDRPSATESQAGRSASRPPTTEDSPYADGTYTATGYYGSVPSSINVTVTLADGAITDVEVTSDRAVNSTSLGYQKRFADAIPAVVVGKPIDEVDVSRVAGASGTSEGFNNAIDRLENEASR